MLTKDMGRGLGPEEYLIRRAPPGEFKIQVKLFNSLGRTVTCVPVGPILQPFRRPVTAMVKIYTNYSTHYVKEYSAMVYLQADKEIVHVASVYF
jgi:hypothetical protein